MLLLFVSFLSNFYTVLGHLQGSNQLFKYVSETKQIVNLDQKLCLMANLSSYELTFSKCDETLMTQKWIWSDFVDEAALKNWTNIGRPRRKDQFFWDE